MMNKKEKIEKFLATVEDDGGKWLKQARWRRDNRGWLKKSQEVAFCVLETLNEQNMQQKELAEAMDVSPQQVSKIVKGKENLTLQTITKLEQVLGVALFEIPRKPVIKKVDVMPNKRMNLKKRKTSGFKKKEPFKNAANGSWSSKEHNSNLALVKV